MGFLDFPGSSTVKNPPAMQDLQEMQIRSLNWEDSLEKEMATHSSILAREIPWTAARQAPLGSPMDRGAWWPAVHGAAKS